MKLVINAVVEGLATRQDGTLKLTLGTNELEPNQAGDLFQLRGKFVKVLLSDTNITNAEALIIDGETMQDGKKIKSSAKRLRSVLFLVHEQANSTMTFEDWYKTEMERLIEHYKKKLDD